MPVMLRGRSKQKSELEMQTLVFNQPEEAAEAVERNQIQKEIEKEYENKFDVEEEETESLSDSEIVQEEEFHLQKSEEKKGKSLEELIVNWCVLRQETTDNFSTRLFYTLPVCFLGILTFSWRLCFNYFLLCFCLALTIAILCFLIFCAPFHLTYRFFSKRFRPQQTQPKPT